MGWRYDELLLYKLAMLALEKFGKQESPDLPDDNYYELTIPYENDQSIYIMGNFDRPRELDVWIRTKDDEELHVIAKDENGTDTMDMYQEADDPIYAGYQGYVIETLKRYSVLDELANL